MSVDVNMMVANVSQGENGVMISVMVSVKSK